MSMNKQRRQMIKATSALAASSVALLATPTWVSAASSAAHTAPAASAPDALRITVSNVGRQTYVTVDNTSRKAVTLTHILPGVVSDENGTFDLNSLLAKGPITGKQDLPRTNR